jgi:pyridoxamine 5'-phosphate oxidase
VTRDPFAIFAKWHKQAQENVADNPDVIALASADKMGRPSVRFVFYRGIRENGFSFFTNYESRKGRELSENPVAAIAFLWPHLGKQVRIEGAVERLSNRESDSYFDTRSLESRVSATISHQSRPLNDRGKFLSELKHLEDTARLLPISRPEYWGGFKVVPARFEFWMRGEHRRHDRLVFEKHRESWTTQHLYP